MGTAREDRKKDYDEAYNDAQAGFSTFHEFARRDLRSYLRNTWTDKDLVNFKQQGRDAMSFPMMRRNIKLITGYERKNRMSVKYEPVEGSDEQTAQIFTAAAGWVMNRGNGYNIVSDAFEACLTTAINLVNVYNDRNSDTFFDRFFYNQFVLDPNFSYRDLSDCQFGILRKYITKDDAKMLLPDAEGLINKSEPRGQDEKFPSFRAPKLFTDKLLAYDEFHKRTSRMVKILINRKTGNEMTFTGNDTELRLILQQFEDLTVITRRVKTVEVTSYIQQEEVSHAVDPFGLDDFSFTPMIAYWDPEHDRMEDKLQSVVHGMVDSQRAHDKRMMAMISQFEQQIGGGLDFEIGALIDDEDAFSTGQKPRAFAKDALAQNRARDRQIPGIDQSQFQLQQLMTDLMAQSVGINDELKGQTVGNPQISGMLAQFRAGQALTGLQDLFDNKAQTLKIVGAKVQRLLQQYPPAKIKRITNMEPTDEFYRGEFGKFDTMAVEGLFTSTQQNLFYNELLNLKMTALKLGQDVPYSWNFVLKHSPVSMKKEMDEEITKNEQEQNEAKQKQSKLQEIQTQLEIELSKGNIMANRAIAEEQRSQAVENTTDAALNRAKTVTEMNDIRSGRLLELLRMAIELETVPQANEEAKAKS